MLYVSLRGGSAMLSVKDVCKLNIIKNVWVVIFKALPQLTNKTHHESSSIVAYVIRCANSLRTGIIARRENDHKIE
jgi:hypothetical protein